MISPNANLIDEQLLRELTGWLSMPGATPRLSLGVVGSPAHGPQPPAHCLRACLAGAAEVLGQAGCPFLKQAALGVVDPVLLAQGRCPQGFQVAAQPVALGGAAAVLVTVEGTLPHGQPVDEQALQAHLTTASRLLQRIGEMLEENAGFAEEVLRNYEQLNLIFDLTQQVSQVTDVRALERLLLERLAVLLHAEAVVAVAPDGEHRQVEAAERTKPPDGESLRGPAAQEAIAAVRQHRQVQVTNLGEHHVIAGPLVRLDDQVDVVLALRAPVGGPFISGDMMIVESVLAFGGQIISNTELHERLRRMSIEVTRALVAAIDKKDHYTSGHSERVGFLTRLTAQELGLPPAEQQTMEWAGLLHDVGKIGIPEDILCKPGKLSAEEFAIVKRHPQMGYEILQPIATLELILDGVRYHHEYPDGSGYPYGLQGDEIPLVARIIHVADTFDALTSTRSYRKAFSMEKAVEIIRGEEGTRADRQVAEAFFRAFERFRREQPERFAAQFSNLQERELENALT